MAITSANQLELLQTAEAGAVVQVIAGTLEFTDAVHSLSLGSRHAGKHPLSGLRG